MIGGPLGTTLTDRLLLYTTLFRSSWYKANSAAGTLNLSQAYREWGMAEMEANRDYYGPVRFDDIEFQMSARGQQLQSRFVESYADRLQDDIEIGRASCRERVCQYV